MYSVEDDGVFPRGITLGYRWMEYHMNKKDWERMLDLLDENLGLEVVRYGEMRPRTRRLILTLSCPQMSPPQPCGIDGRVVQGDEEPITSTSAGLPKWVDEVTHDRG
ncbi:hypothetical protein MLD38_019696 [Melastoma candidum]|uniref:Uncharacterized protein n=1 Tax=Melastoma candidum TaxID=119954 RepID=A0ACB9R1D1_9MYRT|nr:hypothetical protein MLD38_019696 [Melastoma candidum]